MDHHDKGSTDGSKKRTRALSGQKYLQNDDGSNALGTYLDEGTPKKKPIVLSNSLKCASNKFLFGGDDGNFIRTPPKKKSSSPRKRTPKSSPQRFVSKVSPKLNRSPYATQQNAESSKSPSITKTQLANVSLDYINAKNFELILVDVLQSFKDSDLFSNSELEVLNNFRSMPIENKQLYVRMFGRKVGWHRVSNIHYDQISADLSPLFRQLESNGFVTSETSVAQVQTILDILHVQDLKTLCKTLSLKINPKKITKPDLIQNLMHFGKYQRTLAFGKASSDAMSILRTKANALLGMCVSLTTVPMALFNRILLLFSLANASALEEREDVSRHLLLLHYVQIGKMVFPSYSMVKTFLIFPNKDHLIFYEEAQQINCLLTEAAEKKEWSTVSKISQNALDNFTKLLEDECIASHDELLPVFLRKFTGASSYAYSLTMGAEALKKEKTFISEAVKILRCLLSQKLYLIKYRGRWYEQLSLILHHHMNLNTEAAKVIIEALDDPFVSEVWRYALADRGSMLEKRKSGRVELTCKQELQSLLLKEKVLDDPPSISIGSKAVQNNKPGFKKVYITEDFEKEETTYSSVEEFAICHYKKLGFTEGMHCEGAIISSLFGLLFWDIIYELTIPNVFLSAYQSAPLDLSSPEFYPNRKTEIDERLVMLGSWSRDEVQMFLGQVYTLHLGQISIVSWDRFQCLQQVFDIVNCIGMPVLVQTCKRFAKNYRAARSGFPDLFMWDPAKEKSKFIEVKGKGDSLSTKQRVWLDYLIKAEADVEVCLVIPK